MSKANTQETELEFTPEMKEITTKEFDAMLKEQTQYDTQKWTDLELNKVYTITAYRKVETSNGQSVILTLLNNGEVWAPSHLVNKINSKEPPFYVRPLGLKPCKNNKKNKYHAYDLVFPKKQVSTSNFMHCDYVKK